MIVLTRYSKLKNQYKSHAFACFLLLLTSSKTHVKVMDLYLFLVLLFLANDVGVLTPKYSSSDSM